MKILLVHNFYTNTGGEDLRVVNTSHLLRASGQDVVECYKESAHVKGFFSNMLTFFGLFFSFRSFLDVLRVAKREHPQVACIYNVFPIISPSVYVALKISGVPVVQMVANYRPAYSLRDGLYILQALMKKKNARAAFLNRGYCNLYDVLYGLSVIVNKAMGTFSSIICYVSPSEYMKVRLIESAVSKEKIKVIPNFFLSQKIQGHGRRNKKTIIMYAGRLSYEKGVDILLSALGNTFNSKVFIVGDGSEKRNLENFVKRNNLPVSFLGRKTHKETLRVLERADICVVPSRWSEPFGNVILDATACGALVIAASTGGIPEIIQDHKTGLLFNPEDPGDLRKKIDWALSHPREKEKIVSAAREGLKKFKSKDYMKRLVSVFSLVIHASPTIDA